MSSHMVKVLGDAYPTGEFDFHAVERKRGVFLITYADGELLTSTEEYTEKQVYYLYHHNAVRWLNLNTGELFMDEEGKVPA